MMLYVVTHPFSTSWTTQFDFRQEQNFCSHHCVQIDMLNTQPPIQQPGTLSPGVNGPRREADFSLPCRVYSYISLPAYIFMRRLNFLNVRCK